MTPAKSPSLAWRSKTGITMAAAMRLVIRMHHSDGLKGAVQLKMRSVTVGSVYTGRVVTTW